MRSPLDTLEAAFNRVTVFFAALVAISIGLIAVLIPLNLLLVKTGLGTIWWLFEGVEYTLYFGLFLGAPWVLQQGAHVKVDVLVTALSAKAAARLERVMDIFAVGLCLLLCFYGTRAGIIEFIDGTMPDKDLRIANWIILSAFVLAFLMLAVEFLFRMRSERVLKVDNEIVSADAGF